MIGRLIGATILEVVGAEPGSESVSIVTDRGTLRLYHEYDCCESVALDDITGDPLDLVGGVVNVAEERIGDAPEDVAPDSYADSETWTFYEIRTTRGDVTMRWLGVSNGYYSESVASEWVDA